MCKRFLYRGCRHLAYIKHCLRGCITKNGEQLLLEDGRPATITEEWAEVLHSEEECYAEKTHGQAGELSWSTQHDARVPTMATGNVSPYKAEASQAPSKTSHGPRMREQKAAQPAQTKPATAENSERARATAINNSNARLATKQERAEKL